MGGKGKICDQYGIETLDDIAHFSQVNELGSYAFEGCKSLHSAHLQNIKAIGEGTFSGCSNLQEVSFDNLHSINRVAFADCTSLTSVNFPNVTFVGASSFSGCNHLREIRLPNAWNIPNNMEDYNWRSTVASRSGNDQNGRYRKIFCFKLLYFRLTSSREVSFIQFPSNGMWGYEII